MISSRTSIFAAIKPQFWVAHMWTKCHISLFGTALRPLLSQKWNNFDPHPSCLCDAFTDIERQQDQMKTLLDGTGEIQCLVILLLRATAVVRVGRLWFWLLLTRQKCCWLREKRLKKNRVTVTTTINQFQNQFLCATDHCQRAINICSISEKNYFDKTSIKLGFSQGGFPWLSVGDHPILVAFLHRLPQLNAALCHTENMTI